MLGRVVGAPEACAAFQRDLKKWLEKWAGRSHMKFSEHKVLHLGCNNPMHEYMLWATQLDSTSAEKELGVLVDSKLQMRQQCALAARRLMVS